MITVTLQFATIEELIARLGPQPVVLSQGDAAADLAGTPRPDSPSAPASKPAKAAKPAAPAPAVEYPTLQKAVFALAAKNKKKVMELLQELNVGSFKELAADRYADALARVEAATNAEAEVA